MLHHPLPGLGIGLVGGWNLCSIVMKLRPPCCPGQWWSSSPWWPWSRVRFESPRLCQGQLSVIPRQSRPSEKPPCSNLLGQLDLMHHRQTALCVEVLGLILLQGLAVPPLHLHEVALKVWWELGHGVELEGSVQALEDCCIGLRLC